MPKKLLARFPVTPNALIQPGTPLNAAHFEPGQFIDATARVSRRGFQGGMKRHGFSGMPSDARGCTKSHRRIGESFNKNLIPYSELPSKRAGLDKRARWKDPAFI